MNKLIANKRQEVILYDTDSKFLKVVCIGLLEFKDSNSVDEDSRKEENFKQIF